MENRLANETSPYLLMHKDDPVDWYPWSEEAFKHAFDEDKPIFLSIGYSACHWCHVMRHESFEDNDIAELLNRNYISIKVDREERPDIDSIYMSVCQTFTGSGGWPMSIFMTPDQKPFFAGTYFPKTGRGRMLGFKELLIVLDEQWRTSRDMLNRQADEVTAYINKRVIAAKQPADNLLETAVKQYERSYDARYGGFGSAPKFPVPHNILFLLEYYQRFKNAKCLEMAEHTLVQMYRGGLFDHIGYGFCRYSTDERFLVPHFEKMLYDNALLIFAYCRAYAVTGKKLYLKIAEKVACFILREMTSTDGGFYSSQDADSEGKEGRYYLLTPDDVRNVLGSEADEFIKTFGLSQKGNFEGKNIPNLLNSGILDRDEWEKWFEKLNAFRKSRCLLNIDNKQLTAWNCLMTAAMSELYRMSGKQSYLDAARKADIFIEKQLFVKGELYVSYNDGKRGVKGFLDDHAYYCLAKLALYQATFESGYLNAAERICEKINHDFSDTSGVGGFYLYGNSSEKLIARPKETYDGAIPSGNSIMAYLFTRLALLVSEEKYGEQADKQLAFIATEAEQYPMGYSMFLLALLERTTPPAKLTIALDESTNPSALARMLYSSSAGQNTDNAAGTLIKELPANTIIMAVPYQSDDNEYRLLNNKTTFYLCNGHTCLPPVNNLRELCCSNSNTRTILDIG